MLLVGSVLLCNRYKNRYRSDWNTFLNQQHLDKWLFLLFSIDQLIDYHQKTSIAIPENNAKNSAPQSVNYCVTDFRRTPVRLQICSLQFALCSTAFFALFSGLAIEKTMRNTLREFLKLSRQSPRSRAGMDFGSLPA